MTGLRNCTLKNLRTISLSFLLSVQDWIFVGVGKLAPLGKKVDRTIRHPTINKSGNDLLEVSEAERKHHTSFGVL